MENNLMPTREVYPMIINPDLGDYYKLDEKQQKEFRKTEIELLAKQINSLPYRDFTEDREREIARLLTYYTEFTNLFGIDLVAVARTRMQSSATIMKSSPLFMLSMIDDNQKNSESAIFFESRLEAGGFKLNATSQNIIEGFSYRFSVLKRQLKDIYGEYEVDFPAVSLDRIPLMWLLDWHRVNFRETAFENNPILKNMQELFTLRVHDWFHAAVIYDTSSTTNIFQKWSDNSFFVKHFFDNPFMINYELLADKTHYLVWREIFKKDNSLKLKVLDMARDLLRHIDSMENWISNKKVTVEEAGRIGDYLAYVGLRGLFNVIPFDDSELINVIGSNSRFKKVVSEHLAPYKSYLSRIYEGIESIPFRKGKDEKLSMEQIFGEYADALTEEAQLLSSKSIIASILKLDLSGFGYKKVLENFPRRLSKMMDEKGLDLSDYDPRIFQIISVSLDFIRNKFGDDLFIECVRRIEVDDSGYFYFKVQIEEIDETDGWKDVFHFKNCILVQLPWDYKSEFNLIIRRSQNLLAEQIGSRAVVKPGEIILVNIQDEMIGRNLLKEAELNDVFDFDLFFKNLEVAIAKGHNVLNDMYPYESDKVQRVFNIPESMKSLNNGQLNLMPGIYSTFKSIRKAILAMGPISLNSRHGEERRRILSGAIVDNHVNSNSEVDRFPVDAKSFDKFYSGVSRLDLSPFRLKIGDMSLGMNNSIDLLLKSLEQANTIKIYGFRGKPEKVRIRTDKV